MKFLAMHITIQKICFDMFMVGNLENIFMEHDIMSQHNELDKLYHRFLSATFNKTPRFNGCENVEKCNQMIKGTVYLGFCLFVRLKKNKVTPLSKVF